MKPFITKTAFLLTLLCLSLSGYSQFIAHCTIYNEEDVKFTVYLNGEKKNEEPKSNVRIVNLTQAYFKLKIIFEDPAIPPIEKGMFQVHDAHGSPVDAVFIMKKNKKGEWGVHWRSQTPWPGYIQTNQPTVVVVPAGSVVSQTTTTTQQEPSGVRMSFGTPGGSVNINTGGSTAPASQTTTTVVSGGTAGTASPCAGNILGEDDFNSALRSVSSRSTDEGKMLSAKQIISANCISTMHVKKIMQLFMDESKKLEIAQYAYPYTIDKGNYFKLNDEFKDDKNIDALYQGIAK